MELPDHRARRLIGWIGALLMLSLTALVLTGAIWGYVAAMHHQLPPNGVAGFRDATTLSCLPGWYAAQESGFRWFLYLGCPVLAMNVGFGVWAVIRRRSPSEVHGGSLVSLLAAGAAIVIAGVHADRVAVAANGGVACSAPPLQQLGPGPDTLDRVAALIPAVLFAAILGTVNVVLVYNWWRAASGRLQRNPYFGIRLPSTLRSEVAFRIGNRAALRTVPLYVLTGGATVVALFEAAMRPSIPAVIITGIVGFVVFVAANVVTAVYGGHVAKSHNEVAD